MSKKSGIYKIQSISIPTRIYIGSAFCFIKRWNIHLHSLRKNKHHSIKLQRHFNKYGEKDLLFVVLEECEVNSLIEREQFFIDNEVCFFNISKVAGSRFGLKMSESAKEKISLSNKGKISPGKGVKLSEETKRLVGLKSIGRKKSQETIKKISDKLKGRLFSDEHKNKISLGLRGLKKTELHVINNRISQLKRVNKSPKNKGIPHSEETKNKMKEAWKLRRKSLV